MEKISKVFLPHFIVGVVLKGEVATNSICKYKYSCVKNICIILNCIKSS